VSGRGGERIRGSGFFSSTVAHSDESGMSLRPSLTHLFHLFSCLIHS
jgi:hypothetical protein